MKKEIIELFESLDFEDVFVKDALRKKAYSYEDVFGRCLSLEEMIESKSSDKSVVACVMENSMELLALYLTTMIYGKTIMVVDPLKGRDELSAILDNITNKFVIVDKSGASKLQEYDICLAEDYFENLVGKPGIKEIILNKLRQRDFDNDFLLTFTSGTSGNTKGVRNSLNNLFKTSKAFNDNFKIDRENTFAHVMPMTYMAGILNTIFQPICAGAKIVLMGRFSPIRAFTFWQTAKEYGVNTFWLSPSMLTILMKVSKHDVGKDYCQSVNPLFFIGTAALHQSTREEFETKYGATLFASYGLSETLFISTETPETIISCGNNVGKILDGVDYKFSTSGEFLVKVPWMFLGYSNEPTEKYFEGSYYKTGDLAAVKRDVLSITGRAKDLIIKGGINLSPALIENVASAVDGVEEVACFGMMGSLNEENVILAYSTFLTDKDMLEKNIYCAIASKLGKNYLIDCFYPVDSIPKNINGKIDKNILKEQYKNRNDSKV